MEEEHGAGVNISPIGFLVVCSGNNQETALPRFIPVEHKCSIDKLLDYIPDLFDKLSQNIKNTKEKINEQDIKNIVKKEKIKIKDEKNKEQEPEEIYEFEYDETKEDD